MNGLIWIYTIFWKILCFVYNRFYPVQAIGGKMVNPEFFSPPSHFPMHFLMPALELTWLYHYLHRELIPCELIFIVSILLVCSCVSSLRQQIQIRMRSVELSWLPSFHALGIQCIRDRNKVTEVWVQIVQQASYSILYPCKFLHFKI